MIDLDAWFASRPAWLRIALAALVCGTLCFAYLYVVASTPPGAPY